MVQVDIWADEIVDIWAYEIVKEYKDKGLDAANELWQRIANDNKLKLYEKIVLKDKVLAIISRPKATP